MEKIAYHALADMRLSELMRVANNLDVSKNTRLDASDIFNSRIKERYGITKQGDRFDVLSKDPRKSLIKLWLVYKNRVKPKGWPAQYFSYDLLLERDLFEDESMVKERYEREGVFFVKNFYGINKPLTGYRKLYNFAMKLYDEGSLLQLRFYLNTYFTENNNGDFWATEIQSWSAPNHNKQEECSNVVSM